MTTSWTDQSLINAYSDANDDPSKNWYEEKVNIPAIVDMLPAKGARVLDFGCGPGNFSARLAGIYSVSGADASEGMVAKARENHPDLNFFVWDGLTPLPNAEAPYAAVVTKLTFEFIEDLDPVAKNIYNALSPGGLLVVSVQHPLLPILTHPEENIPYWGTPKTDVQIGSTGIKVSKHHRNLADYVNPFIQNRFTLTKIDEPEIPADIAASHNAQPKDLKIPKRLNLQFHKKGSNL